MSSLNTSRIEELLSELLRWTKFAGAKEVRGVLTTTLDTDQKKLIYHLSDGANGSVEIAKAAKTSDRTVRRYWETWSKQGIVDAMKVRGGDRYKKSFELDEFGIRVPATSEQSLPGTAQKEPSSSSPLENSQSTQRYLENE